MVGIYAPPHTRSPATNSNSGTPPIQWIKAKFNVTMERQKVPIRNPFDVAMFQGVDVTIIDVRRIILVVADHVFPKPTLP